MQSDWPPMMPMEAAPKDGTEILVATERGFGVAAWIETGWREPDAWAWAYHADGDYCTEPYDQDPLMANPSRGWSERPGTHLIGWWPLPERASQ